MQISSSKPEADLNHLFQGILRNQLPRLILPHQMGSPLPPFSQAANESEVRFLIADFNSARGFYESAHATAEKRTDVLLTLMFSIETALGFYIKQPLIGLIFLSPLYSAH